MLTYNKKQIEATINSFVTGEEHQMTVVANSSYSVSDESDKLYQRFRYYAKKIGGVKVSREYNTVYLSKTV